MNEEWKANAARTVAELMALAATTAPKGRGINNIVVEILDEDQIARLARNMKEKAPEAWGFFVRDGGNIEKSDALVLIGTKASPLGLNCGYCGFPSCSESKRMGAICAFNTGDLGIAIGSAVAVASQHHADNRVMFSAGWMAISIGLFDEDVKIAYVIPLSISGKNPFFDRG